MKIHKNDNRKRILLVGINFSPELTGIGKYTGEMMDWLSDHHYDCTVVTTFPYYPMWKVQKPYKSNSYEKEVQKDGRLQVYRCPIYVPGSPSGKKRILHDASFFLSALMMIIYLLFKKKNDYIFCIAPPFHIGFLGIFYRFFKGGKMIYHVQDLQIEAARDLNIIKSKSVFKLLFGLERFILKRANHVTSVSLGMIGKILAKVDKTISALPNWVDTELFHPLHIADSQREHWGFKRDDKVVVYSGSIGEKQGLDSLIGIARDLAIDPSIKFVICGSGPYKEKLEQAALDMKLTNMTFLPLQPAAQFNAFLNMADVHLVLQKRDMSELMLPSKLTTIWSAGGLALVTADEGSSVHKTITEHDMAVVIACERPELLKAAILDCCNTPYLQKRANARAYARNFLSKEPIFASLVSMLEDKVTETYQTEGMIAHS